MLSLPGSTLWLHCCIVHVLQQDKRLCFFSRFVTSCVFVSNLNESSAAPDLQQDHRSIQAVLQKDLVMNVFRDGRWGSFRHQLITHGSTRTHTAVVTCQDALMFELHALPMNDITNIKNNNDFVIYTLSVDAAALLQK